MVRSASLSVLPSAYDHFLYAPVGENTNGAWLTVLSLLARQNLDPWEEAAELSRLPHGTAVRRLTSMITASPGQASNTDQTAIADRLIALLPRRIASVDRTPNALHGESPVHRFPATVSLMVIAIYLGAMALSQWMAASVFEKTPVGVASAPSPQSALGERLPSAMGDAKTKSPQ